ncbi:MAG: hypothetical protein EVB11_02835 [Winogradskyella sp.]|nr:MAG: hypothetical protein EVB11_02835 [Winogradskyella sp.]
MKRSVLLLLFVFNVQAIFAQNSDWIKIKDNDAAYIINFPSQPEKADQDVPTDKGTVKMYTYTLQTTDDTNIIYMSSFTEYPNSFFPNKLESAEMQNEVLDNSVNGAVTNTKGTLASEKKIFLNGYRGRMIKISIEGGFIIQMKVILVGIKLYLAQVIYTEENEDNLNSKRFFDSLELINVKP